MKKVFDQNDLDQIFSTAEKLNNYDNNCNKIILIHIPTLSQTVAINI